MIPGAGNICPREGDSEGDRGHACSEWEQQPAQGWMWGLCVKSRLETAEAAGELENDGDGGQRGNGSTQTAFSQHASPSLKPRQSSGMFPHLHISEGAVWQLAGTRHSSLCTCPNLVIAGVALPPYHVSSAHLGTALRPRVPKCLWEVLQS